MATHGVFTTSTLGPSRTPTGTPALAPMIFTQAGAPTYVQSARMQPTPMHSVIPTSYAQTGYNLLAPSPASALAPAPAPMMYAQSVAPMSMQPADRQSTFTKPIAPIYHVLTPAPKAYVAPPDKTSKISIVALPLSGSPMEKLFADSRDTVTARHYGSQTLTLKKDGTYTWFWDFYEGCIGYSYKCETEESGKFTAEEVEPGKFRISYSDSVWTHHEPMAARSSSGKTLEWEKGVGLAPNHVETDVVIFVDGKFNLENSITSRNWRG